MDNIKSSQNITLIKTFKFNAKAFKSFAKQYYFNFTKLLIKKIKNLYNKNNNNIVKSKFTIIFSY